MSLADDLEYRHRLPNRVQRLIQRVAGSRPGAWLFSLTLRRLDRALLRMTAGHRSVTSALAGLPVIELTTVGVRTGRPRSTFLLGIPFEEALAVAGANFAQARQPRWVTNLAAHPHAEVAYRGRTVRVVARLVSDAEFAEIQSLSREVYPGSEAYVRRVRKRQLRVFALAAEAVLSQDVV
jgi:deazaflavin-dependent oxidoreductase (nitroreductase family)